MKKFITYLIICILLTISFLFSIFTCYYLGYKAACEDFFEGHVKMNLVFHSNGTADWEWNDNYSFFEEVGKH